MYNRPSRRRERGGGRQRTSTNVTKEKENNHDQKPGEYERTGVDAVQRRSAGRNPRDKHALASRKYLLVLGKQQTHPGHRTTRLKIVGRVEVHLFSSLLTLGSTYQGVCGIMRGIWLVLTTCGEKTQWACRSEHATDRSKERSGNEPVKHGWVVSETCIPAWRRDARRRGDGGAGNDAAAAEAAATAYEEGRRKHARKEQKNKEQASGKRPALPRRPCLGRN